MRRLKLLPLVALSALLTYCAPPPPPPAPAPSPLPPPAPPPPVNWRDAPLTPGGWSYRTEGMASVAVFGLGGAAQPLFTVRCDRQVRAISLNRRMGGAGAQPGTLKLVTTFGEGQWPAAPDTVQPLLTTRLAATDPMLDKLAYSLGRFMVEVSGAVPLILPAWPEVARVIEDCRG